jgi:hypothetical protein
MGCQDSIPERGKKVSLLYIFQAISETEAIVAEGFFSGERRTWAISGHIHTHT